MLDILRSDPKRAGLKRGMQVTADAVAATFGPCGRPVIVGDPRAPMRVARTGLAVARSMHFGDRAETTGAALLRQVADWVQEAAGDGTAGAVVVAHLLARECVNLAGVGFDPVALREGAEAALGEADRQLALAARPADGPDALRHVAATAAGDARLGALVANAAARSGGGNLVVVEEGEGPDARVETVDGIAIEADYAAPRVVTLGGRRRDRCRLHRPLVLILRGRLDRPEALAPILDHARRAHRALLVVAEEVAAHAAAAPLLQDPERSPVRTLVVAPPRAAPDGGAALLERLAALTGATVVGDDKGGVALEALAPRHLGEASAVLADATRTLVVGTGVGRGPSDTRGGLVVLRVPARGGPDDGDLRVRAERAAHAVHGATAHGVVPGGGVALLGAAAALAEAGRAARGREARLAYSVVQRALEEPFRRLAQNAGIAPAGALRRLHRRDDLDHAGLSLPAGEVVDVSAAGILDPLPALHGALHAAACAARLLLTTEAAAARGRCGDPPWGELGRVG